MNSPYHTVLIFLVALLLPAISQAHPGHGSEHGLVHPEWIVGAFMLVIFILLRGSRNANKQPAKKHSSHAPVKPD